MAKRALPRAPLPPHPGGGETKLAQAVAGEAPAACLSVGPRDILGKFVGESEASVRGYQNAIRHRTPMRWKRMPTGITRRDRSRGVLGVYVVAPERIPSSKE